MYYYGLNYFELEFVILEQYFIVSMLDHRCGYCSLLPNLLKGFGWNPGNKLLKWFGEQLKDRTGDADITFRQVSSSVHSPDLVCNTLANQVMYFRMRRLISFGKSHTKECIRSCFSVCILFRINLFGRSMS